MLSAGVHPKVASERLGHSTVGITLDLYTHSVPSLDADAAERIQRVVRGTEGEAAGDPDDREHQKAEGNPDGGGHQEPESDRPAQPEH